MTVLARERSQPVSEPAVRGKESFNVRGRRGRGRARARRDGPVPQHRFAIFAGGDEEVIWVVVGGRRGEEGGEVDVGDRAGVAVQCVGELARLLR